MNVSTLEDRIKKFGKVMLESPIKWVQLWVTEKCNLTCSYCSSYDNSSKNDPSLETLKERSKKLHKLGVGMIALYGGEPSIRDDLPELVAHINGLGSISYIATNGTFGRDYLRRLGEAGIGIVHIAADYFDDVREPRRTDRKYLYGDKLQMFLEGREEFGYILALNICATPQNRDHIERLFEVTKKECIYVVIRPAVRDRTTLSSTNIINSAFPSPEEIVDLANYCLEKRREGVPISQPEEYFHELRRYAKGEPLEWKCKSAELFLVINIHGDITPCSEIHIPTKVNLDSLNLDDLEGSILRSAREEITKKFLPWCNRQCTQTTPFCTSHYTNQPSQYQGENFGVELLKQKIK